jgi:hypothetical protein
MRLVQFPKLKTNKHTLEQFYKDCLKQTEFKPGLYRVRVVAFFVNPKDYKRIASSFEKYVKTKYNFSKKRIQLAVGLELLDIGPCTEFEVEEGTVIIDSDNLYEDSQD